jgi:hypothetical protein
MDTLNLQLLLLSNSTFREDLKGEEITSIRGLIVWLHLGYGCYLSYIHSTNGMLVISLEAKEIVLVQRQVDCSDLPDELYN